MKTVTDPFFVKVHPYKIMRCCHQSGEPPDEALGSPAIWTVYHPNRQAPLFLSLAIETLKQ